MSAGRYSAEEARTYLATIDATREIVEGVPAVTYIDADDDLNTPLYISPQIQDVLGYTVEEWMADPAIWVNSIHADDREWVLEENVRHTAEMGPYRAEYRMVAKGGTTVWVRDESIVVYAEDGRSIYWRGMLIDVTELKATEERLRRSLDMLRHAMSERRMLLRRLEDAGEQERRRIAGDIHDDSIQVMASVSLRLQALYSDLPEGRYRAMDEIREMVDQAIDRLRHLVFELRPPALDAKGLLPALRQYLERSGAEGGFDFRIEDHLEVDPPPDVRTLTYRICQEAIANVREHANARLVEISMAPKGSGIAITVADDGDGFDPATATEPVPGHLGVVAMKERAEMAGGTFAITSVPGQGTKVEFWLPIEAPMPSAGS